MSKPTYTHADLALAYELHNEGCTWKLIAWFLGFYPDTLRNAVYRAKREGLKA